VVVPPYAPAAASPKTAARHVVDQEHSPYMRIPAVRGSLSHIVKTSKGLAAGAVALRPPRCAPP